MRANFLVKNRYVNLEKGNKMDFREEIEEKGYVVLPDLITEKACDQYKVLLEDQYEIYAPNYAGNAVKLLDTDWIINR